MGAQIESVTSDWANGVDHGGAWPIKLVAMKYRAVEGAWRIADTALEVSGGFGMFKKSEMERLFRDARCGRFLGEFSLSHELKARWRWHQPDHSRVGIGAAAVGGLVAASRTLAGARHQRLTTVLNRQPWSHVVHRIDHIQVRNKTR